MSSWSGFSFLQDMLGWGVATRRHGRVRIVRDGQCLASLSLELANTISQRAKGLMGRATLEGADGMLFVYPWPRTVRIWMSGTVIPLDAIFVDRSGKVINIAADMQPYSRKWVSSDKPVKWVLEIAGGRTALLDIQVDDQLEFEH